MAILSRIVMQQSPVNCILLHRGGHSIRPSSAIANTKCCEVLCSCFPFFKSKPPQDAFSGFVVYVPLYPWCQSWSSLLAGPNQVIFMLKKTSGEASTDAKRPCARFSGASGTNMSGRPSLIPAADIRCPGDTPGVAEIRGQLPGAKVCSCFLERRFDWVLDGT